MDVRIGVTDTPREVDVEMAEDTDRDAFLKQVEAALDKGDGVLALTDKRGRSVLLPVPRIAYVEIGSAHDERRVGFGAH